MTQSNRSSTPTPHHSPPCRPPKSSLVDNCGSLNPNPQFEGRTVSSSGYCWRSYCQAVHDSKNSLRFTRRETRMLVSRETLQTACMPVGARSTGRSISQGVDDAVCCRPPLLLLLLLLHSSSSSSSCFSSSSSSSSSSCWCSAQL